MSKVESHPLTGQPNLGGAKICPPSYIRRKAYQAIRRGKTVRVKGACIKDRGAPGRWQTVKNMLGIGPLKKGSLTTLGYSHLLPATRRHSVVSEAVRKYGRNTTLRKLNAIAVYTKRTAPTRSRIYKSDVHYVQKNF